MYYLYAATTTSYQSSAAPIQLSTILYQIYYLCAATAIIYQPVAAPIMLRYIIPKHLSTLLYYIYYLCAATVISYYQHSAALYNCAVIITAYLLSSITQRLIIAIVMCRM